MRVTVKGWWTNRDLSYAEAEAYHLREAAKLAGDMNPDAIERQAEHLYQARLNRTCVHRVLQRPQGPPPHQGSGGSSRLSPDKRGTNASTQIQTRPPDPGFIVVRPGTSKGGLNDPPTSPRPLPPLF